jgi:hypothetical protein
MRAKKAFQVAAIALFMMCFTAWAKPSPRQIESTVPHWADLPADTSAKLKAEGITAENYERLLQGEVVIERRPVPDGKSGVHVVTFGIIPGGVDKLWGVLENCGKSPPIMPYLQSCRIVEPDYPIPPNSRWEQLKIDFHMAFFSIKTMLVNENTVEAPNFLRWKQVRGDAKVNEGYYRIISITSGAQLIVYDALVDPGGLIPGFVKTWVVENTLPDLITALRDHV